MSYKEWLEKTLKEMLKAENNKINLFVCEQANARFGDSPYDCTIVINDLGGNTDSDIEVIPIQLMCFSSGQGFVDENGDTPYDTFYKVLKEFCRIYNRQSMIINNFDYYKMNYVQPLPINPMEQSNNTFRLNCVVSGSLTISRNISDINKIFINGQEIPFLTARLGYATSTSSSQKITQRLQRTRITTATTTLQVEMYNRNNIIGNITRALRTEEMNPNTPLNVKLSFNDGIEEEYTCIITENTIVSDKINPSSTSYVFNLY